MNDCIEQASSSGFGWIVLALIVIVLGLVIYKNGWVATEGMLKSLATKARAKAEKLEAKVKARIDQKAPAVPVRTKAQRIAEAQAVLSAGAITQADFETAKAKILAE